jgi:nuclear pore complex protein Nup155
MSSLTRSTSSAHHSDAPPTRSLSSSSSAQQQQQQQQQQQLQSSQKGTQSAPAEPVDSLYGPLDKAGKVVEERLARDDKWVGIGDSLVGEWSVC